MCTNCVTVSPAPRNTAGQQGRQPGPQRLPGGRRLGGWLEHRVAVGTVRPERPAAVQRLLELVGHVVVELRARIIRAVGERVARAVEREPRVDAVRAAVTGAVLVHLCLAAEVTDGRPLTGRGPVGEGDRL